MKKFRYTEKNPWIKNSVTYFVFGVLYSIRQFKVYFVKSS